jgi:Uma2 family endonuclease
VLSLHAGTGPQLILSLYAREGVSHIWLVDPEQRTLEVLRLEERRYAQVSIHDGTAFVRAEPFEALAWELDLL